MASLDARMENARLFRLLTRAALVVALVLLVLLLVGEGSVMHVWQLNKQIAVQEAELVKLKQRNEILEAQVRSLKENLDSMEGLARGDLGMIRQGETFYLVTDPDKAEDAAAAGAGP